MTLTLEISPELEQALRETAARAGIPLDRYILNLLQQRVVQEQDTTALLPQAEGDLLQKINEGMPEATWERYHDLKKKRDAQTLTEEERAELLTLVNEIEIWNARRLAFVGELARLRQMRLSDLVKQLGLTPPSHA
jgi:hypothetical protein